MCTDFLVNIPGETAVVGRSMEFAAPLNATVQFVRQNDNFVSVESDRKWTVNYSYVAVKGNIEAAGKTISMTTDGQNTEGLSVGALWFKGFADFPGIQKPTVGVNLCHAIDFILANYSTVQQVIDDINSKKLVIWGLEIESIAAPIHFPIHDKTGASGVIEYTKLNKNIEIDLHTPEELRRARINPAAVITNSPGLEWHLNNLGYYASLTHQATTIPVGVQPTIAKPKPYPVEGMGAGYRGIPGDSFPASRFVSTFYRLQDSVNYITNVQSTDPSLPKSDPVNLAFHLLNAVDISFGQSKDFVKSGPHDSKYKYDYTQWVVVKDLINNKMHVRTYENLNIHTIDLNAIFNESKYITHNVSYKLSNPIPPLAAN